MIGKPIILLNRTQYDQKKLPIRAAFNNLVVLVQRFSADPITAPRRVIGSIMHINMKAIIITAITDRW